MTNAEAKQVILIVDDEPVNIRLLQTLFKGHYRLLAATNGQKALQIAQSEPPPDLILLDVMMPDMDGFEVLEQLKSNPSTADIAVLFLTAKLNEEAQDRGLALGALDYISKPINTNALKRKVENHLTSIRQRKFIESLVAQQAETIINSSKEADIDHQRSEQLIKQYLDTITQERERLQLALWASGNELWDWNLSTGEVNRNNEFEGLELPEKLPRDSVFTVYSGYIHPDDMRRFESDLTPVLSGKETDFELNYRVRCKDRGWVWIQDMGRVISINAQGIPLRIVGTIKDVNESKLAERRSQILASAMKNTSDGVWIANADFEIEIINEAFTDITGWDAEEIIGKRVSFPATDKQDGDVMERIMKHLHSHKKWSGEVWAQGKHRIYPEELRIDVVQNANEESIYYVGVFTDITYRKRAEEELIKLANYDQLTGLPNRTLFHERLRQLTQSGRFPLVRFAVLFIDLDNFKRINDSLGHDVGDELLVSVASSLTKIMRNQDIVARLGGDEFIMIVDNLDHTHVAAKVASRVIEAVGEIRDLKGHSLIVTPSIGISIFPDDGRSGEELLKNADCAMYESKKRGKSNYHFYTETMNMDALTRLDLETALRKAIDQSDIHLHYQPKVDLATGDIGGAEVLARWILNEQFISPETFISIAEEAGLIKKLGEQILRKACLQYQYWVEKGLAKGRIAINLSAHQFEDEALVDTVERILQETGLSADYLELEITESMVVNETQKAIEQMHQLRKLGITLAIDDFGTGYSSLSYLKEFPVNTLKIDRCFINDMLNTDRNRNIVELIVNMAHTLSMNVVAEGVETIEQAKAIKLMNAEEIQGYLFSKPIPAEEFEQLLAKAPNLNEKLKRS